MRLVAEAIGVRRQGHESDEQISDERDHDPQQAAAEAENEAKNTWSQNQENFISSENWWIFL